MAKQGVDARSIQAAPPTHIHSNHTRSLNAVLKQNNTLTGFLTASFPSNFKADAERRGGVVGEVCETVKLHDYVAAAGVP